MARLVSARSCVVTTFLVGFRQAMYLVTSTGSSFAHKTTSKGRKLLYRILENTSFVCCDNIQEIKDTNEEPSTVKSEHTSSTFQPLNPHPNHGNRTKKKFSLQNSLSCLWVTFFFEDYGNTSNYSCQKRPPVSCSSPVPLEKIFLKDMV